jgi:hypothetical protein
MYVLIKSKPDLLVDDFQSGGGFFQLLLEMSNSACQSNDCGIL